MSNLDVQISELRVAVRKLEATGPDGFEGLMAAVLTDITKTGFALASSGAQRGKDGQSALNKGAVMRALSYTSPPRATPRPGTHR
jgi:hypothetical protein